MGKKPDNDRKIEIISLEIANYWTSNGFLTETNERCGTLVAFDAVEGYLIEVNTNINLGESELDNFKFDVFVEFLKKNNFTFVLGLRNIQYAEENPSPEWTDKLKEILKSNDIDYDEYIIDQWPYPIPEFDVPDNIFMLRYSYDEYSKIDQLAAYKSNFANFMNSESDWKNYYKDIESVHIDYFEKTYSIDRMRVIVLCSDVENLILHDGYSKDDIEVS